MMELKNKNGKWQWFNKNGAVGPKFTSRVLAQDWFWDTYVGV